ncbi:2621_t:CDS:2 [Funneliformis geosporum]|uniref:9892_t:CDS:1 n=1 Tax=Funneliformis geosporum TaxID=1117311 RepID=A0A9W4T1N6_9GLOM|nr:9892_t:CDS:2 [Funneliformis geosporum]CAI2190125.1 2621_t:CDS:2 [Funneliformis geosporum]
MSQELSIKDIAREIYVILYSKRKNEQRIMIRTYFDANAEEPIIFVQGHEEIIRQFLLMATIFISITTEIYSITDSVIAGDNHIVSIDAIIKYRLPLKPILFRQEIELRTITKFEFNEQKKIVRHEDIWSIKDLLENVPFMGWIYSYFGRKSIGLITNQLVEWMGTRSL